MCCHFGAQILFGVLQRILDDRGVFAREFLAQRFQVLIDLTWRTATHGEGPLFMMRSTKFRVPDQMAVRCASTPRPWSVIR